MKHAIGRYRKKSLYGCQVIDIEGREYEPQHRTIKTNLGNKYYSLPALQFNKCLMTTTYFNFHEAKYNRSAYIYTVTTIVDGELNMISFPNMAGDIVCLGEATNNEFLTKKSLTLDEFVDLFWFTRFTYVNKLPDVITISKIYGSPSLWMDEKYNLSLGWKKT